MARFEITCAEEAQRLRCPNGHSSVAPTNHHFWCRSCADHWEDVDPEFDQVRDALTGEEYTRDEVQMDEGIPGCYYA